MKLYHLVAVVTSAYLAMGLAPVGAADFSFPTVEYSADMTMIMEMDGGGQTYTVKGKLYSAIEKERREVSSFGRKTIVIKTEHETITLVPDQKVYMKNQPSESRKDPAEMIESGELRMTKDGTETINGRLTTRYKIESAHDGGKSFSGHAWFTKQNIPVRFKGTSSDSAMRQNVLINYSNIVVAKQDPYLFKPPKGYRLLPSGMGGMGGGSTTMTPEQMDKFKERMRNQGQQ